MILFLSESFLKGLNLSWKSELRAFLIGSRNLFFFSPESVIETQHITPEAIDSFLKKTNEAGLQLIGFLTPEEGPSLTGYISLQTNNSNEPKGWQAHVAIHNGTQLEKVPLEIRIGGSN
ncbi:MAG: hypothetical protein C5B54_03890 [Acidobacteria bacterium]|nr:MAG: hypothetical protein C5B54_03890 [Acidobacteriota bacterium]